MARSMSASAFRQQLGPLALVQRPRKTSPETAARLQASADDGPTSLVQPGVILARMVLLAIETEDLDVAILPPMGSADELLVGRQPDCDLVIDHDSVSHRHAALRWDESTHRCSLKDFGSTNGTFVNIVTPITGEVVLSDGDIVSFGNVAFLFLLAETLHAKLMQAAGSIGPGPRK
ncbi:MAG: FHA domain-containing protein [Deltaproteobacteria bacterium]|nr:FHA domain-containing protein [Deltaproteobacteria bacterium]